MTASFFSHNLIHIMKKVFTLVSILSSLTVLSQTTVTFNYTGSVQTFTVPPCVNALTIDVQGAQGGSISNLSQSPNTAAGGKGGRVQGTLAVTPGQVLQIYVGQQGASCSATLSCTTNAGGFNGGGNGIGGYNSYNYNAAGGGGASDIRFAPYTLNDRAVTAGGGGGPGCSGCTGAGLDGGDGGGLTAADGANSSCFTGCQNGKGGTQSAGGAQGVWACGCGNAGMGTLGFGGKGNDSASSCSGGVTCGCGGGGGGGYYGGGGGSNGPGGGGSSYTSGTVTGVTHTPGFKTGDGVVTITYTPCTGIIGTNNMTEFNAYPDPFENFVNVTTETSSEICLFSILGNEIYAEKFPYGTNRIDTSRLPAGIYFLQVRTAAGTGTKKIVKH